MKANKAKRLKDLKAENAALKKMLAKAELSQAMLKHLAEKNGYPRTVTPGPPTPSKRSSRSRNDAPARSWASAVHPTTHCSTTASR